MPLPSTHIWLTVADLKARFRVRSASTIWAWVGKGDLPKPHHINQRAVWRAEDVTAAEARIIQPPEAV